MQIDKQNKDEEKKESSKPAVKPDEETLNTSDPQEHMDGPFSSLAQSLNETMDGRDMDEEKADEEEG